MGSVQKSRNEARRVRQARVRKSLRGTELRPRVTVYRSLKFTYVQVISDESGKVLAALSTKDLESKSKKSVESAFELGKKLSSVLKEKKVEAVVFDRNGYLFHGRVKAVADGAREGGLEF